MLSKRNFYLLHFFICSIGLLKIPDFLSWALENILDHPTIEYNEGVRFLVFPQKREELYFYGLTIVIYFIYYLIAYIVVNRLYNKANKEQSDFLLNNNRLLLNIYLILLLVVNFSILILTFDLFPPIVQYLLNLVKLVLWLGIFLLPFYRDYWSKVRFDRLIDDCIFFWSQLNFSEVIKFLKLKPIYYLLVLAIFIQMLSMFMPYIQGNILMMNELINIPEETLINGEFVDNTNYINQHKLPGFPKYDVEKGMPKPTPDRYAMVPQNELLNYFIKKHKDAYYYNDQLKALFINRGMAETEYQELQQIYASESSDKNPLKRLGKLFYASNFVNEERTQNSYLEEEVKFLKKNKLEIHWQILNRWVMHHHNFLLGAINEYALGKQLNNINMQYGYFNTIILKNILDLTGGITYQNYFRVLYSFYPFYYILYIILLVLIFKNVKYILITLILAFSCLNYINYQFLFLAPGLNPIRHFFDVFILGFLSLYFKSKRKLPRLLLLTLTLASALLEILNNKQFGLFSLVALLITMIVKVIAKPSDIPWLEKLLLIVATIIGVFLYKWVETGQNKLLNYYLNGLAATPANITLIVTIILFISLCYIILLKFFRVKSQLKYLALFLLIYFQGFLIYYVWNANEPDFFKVGSTVFPLAIVVMLKLVIDNSRKDSFTRSTIVPLVLIMLLMTSMYLPSLKTYYKSKNEYTSIFNNHRTYQWKLDRANFKSTMNPKYFINDVNLIKKYSDKPAIYIISKYDNFLPFIANKYSAMPFPDLQWFLNTAKEVEQCIDKILTDKPVFIFADSDIERNLLNEIIYDSPVRLASNIESVARVQRLNELNKIYSAVKDDYELVEKGDLVSVYRRKTASV